MAYTKAKLRQNLRLFLEVLFHLETGKIDNGIHKNLTDIAVYIHIYVLYKRAQVQFTSVIV